MRRATNRPGIAPACSGAVRSSFTASGSNSDTFTAAKECPMHDHLIPSLRGKVTVTE